MPIVSVIIPTHNRSGQLKRTLDALCRQSYSFSEIEVVVVMDGCTDDTLEMLRHYEAPFDLRIMPQSNLGPAEARNRGAASASGEVLIFLDDDIEAAPSLIEAHVKAHRQYPGHVVIGYLPLALSGKNGFFNNELRTWWEAMFDVMRQPGHRYTYKDLLSGNFSIEREVFERLGGFNPHFWCHEDYEFGIRLIKEDIPLVFAIDAFGYHYEMTDLERSLQRKYEEGRADIPMVYLHPELRSVLPLARFKGGLSFRGRMLCALAFRWPAAGNLLLAPRHLILGFLEKAGLQRYWRRLLDGLLAYFYWRGVAEVLGTEQDLEKLLENNSASANENTTEIEIDLREGIEAAEKRLDKERPASVRLRYGQWPVGHILPKTGAENLRSTHLRPALATQLVGPFMKALAIEGAIDLKVNTQQVLTVSSPTSFESDFAKINI